MRLRIDTTASLVLAAVVAAGGMGCSSRADDCELNANCGGAPAVASSSHSSTGTHGGGHAPASTTGGGASDGGASSSGGHGGGTSSSGGLGGGASSSTGVTMHDCTIPSGVNAIDEACAVFVSSSAPPGGDGSRAAPYVLLADAIHAAASKQPEPLQVYACGNFSEAVDTTDSIEMWGGFTCNGSEWTWDASESKPTTGWTTPLPDQVPLRANGQGMFKIHDMMVTAQSGSAPSGSSIAIMFGPGVVPTLDQCVITAAFGVNGVAAVTPAAAPNAITGPDRTQPGCLTESPGAPTGPTCVDGVNQAGDGGSGGLSVDKNGAAGTQGRINGQARTSGGVGGVYMTTGCTQGQNGTDASVPGSTGAGAKATDIAFDPTSATAYATLGDGAPGSSGASGEPGAGGGGRAGPDAPCAGMLGPGSGPPGGNGQSGACGGVGAPAGTAGGSSFGVVCMGNMLTLTSTVIVTGLAGRGGAGAIGGAAGTITKKNPQGALGTGGAGAAIGCQGGSGGSGTPGGASGGGRGGHSAPVAFATSPTALTFTTDAGCMLTPGTAGAQGPGGNTSNSGAAGIAIPCIDFGNMGNACP